MDKSPASVIAAWHSATPRLVSLLGAEGFACQLDQSLHALVPFDLSCVFAYSRYERPAMLHDGLRGVSSAQIMENYLNGTYLLDAVYSACIRATPAGLYRLGELAPDAFFEGEYYNSPDVHPCISMESGSLSEEIVFLVPVQHGFHVAYSLLRKNRHPAFRDSEMAILRQTAPMVIELAAKHWGNSVLKPAIDHADHQNSGEFIERAFETFAPKRLTLREQTIVSLILRGHSSVSIGKILQIAEGTVKIHRKNIYSKLAISSQTELFNLFIQHLLSDI